MTETIFDKIIRREIPADIVYEDELCLAFRDVNPQAPVHILVVPKQPVENVLHLQPDQRELAGAILLAAAQVAREQGVAETGIRIVLNAGSDGGQTVPYLHAHVLGGRALGGDFA